MDDLAKIVSDLATQVALINRDIKQIQENSVSIHSKLDSLKEQDRTIAAQQSLLDSYERRLNMLESQYSDFRTFTLTIQNDFNERMQVVRDTTRESQANTAASIIRKLEEMENKIDKKLTDKESRIRNLEQYRWYLLGIVFAVAFFFSGVPWSVVFK